MKFPRHYRLLRGPFDMAPFAAVLFLLVMLLMLGTLIPTTGIPLQLPVSDDLPALDNPAVAMAVDAHGRFYYANQIVTEDKLKIALKAAARKSRDPLTLVIHADKSVTYEQLVHLTLLAREADITNTLLATLPRSLSTPIAP
jgi:biopolymer transport protein ExbD